MERKREYMSNVKKPKNRELQKTITPVGRASYAYVLSPQKDKKGVEKYQLTVLIKKTNNMSNIRAIVDQAMITQFGSDKSEWPEDWKNPIKNGDGKIGIDKKTGKRKEGYADCYVIRASCLAKYKKPEVVDKENEYEEIISVSDFYSGCYCRMEIYASYYGESGNEGVTFYLEKVLKVKDGKPLGGGKSAKEVFGSVNDGGEEDTEDTEVAEQESEEQEDFT